MFTENGPSVCSLHPLELTKSALRTGTRGRSWERTCLWLQETQETWVQSLGREDPLEKEMATHSSILAWRIPWTEEPGGLQSMGHNESDMTVHMRVQTHTE